MTTPSAPTNNTKGKNMSDSPSTTTNNPIVVAVNGSNGSLAAIRYGANEAMRVGCDLHIVHVAPSYIPGDGLIPGAATLSINQFEAVGRDILKAATKEAREILPRDRVKATLELGNRTAGVLSAAKEARLLLVGDDRSPMLARLAVGGFIGTVAARTPVPMVSVPQDWTGLRDPEIERRVVLGLKDPQRIPFDVLRAGFQAAHDHAAKLEITHVWGMAPAYGDLITSMMDYRSWQTMVERFVRRTVEPLREEFADVDYVTTTWYGQPAHILCERAMDAELLLLTRREHGFPLGHFGATGKALLREVMCPVEVLPLAERAHASTTSTGYSHSNNEAAAAH